MVPDLVTLVDQDDNVVGAEEKIRAHREAATRTRRNARPATTLRNRRRRAVRSCLYARLSGRSGLARCDGGNLQ